MESGFRNRAAETNHTLHCDTALPSHPQQRGRRKVVSAANRFSRLNKLNVRLIHQLARAKPYSRQLLGTEGSQCEPIDVARESESFMQQRG
jgi:hypothetical protein